MILHLKSYSSMKDSGVPWLGEVPAHWDVQPIARIGVLFKGRGGSKEDEASSGIPCVRYGDLYTRHEFFITSSKGFVSAERASVYTPIRYGDVLFAGSGETIEDIGRSAVNLLDADAVCGGDVIVLRPKRNINPRFLGYAADAPASRHQKATMGRGFTVVHIYGSELKRLALAIPPPDEQVAIVGFLDHADRRIRRYIRAKQKLIKLLDEQKQAVINRTIIHGVFERVGFKSSGVPGWPQIPTSYQRVRLGRVCLSIRDGTHNPPPAAPGLHRLLSVRNIIGGRFMTRPDDRTMTPNAFKELQRSYDVRRGDVVIALVGATTGKSAVVEEMENVTVQRSIGILRPDPRALTGEFLNLLIRSELVQGQIRQVMNKYAAQPGIYLEEVGRLQVCVPILEEQQAIVNRVESDSRPLDVAKQRANVEIDLLKEYRTRLIADVVTGKVDVREAAARLPEDTGDVETLDEADSEIEGEDSAEQVEAVAEEAEA